MITDKLKVVLSFLLIVIIMFGGYNIMNMANSTPTKVRMLIGGAGSPFILIDLVHNSIFEVTIFYHSWSWAGESTTSCENASDDTLLDDFILMDQHLYEMLKNPFDSPAVADRIVLNNKIVELSQQQWETLWNQVEYVANNDTDGAFEQSLTWGLPYIWAIIDGRFYWSLYDRFTALSHPYNPSVNRNLVLLADDLTSLADVSPFRSGR